MSDQENPKFNGANLLPKWLINSLGAVLIIFFAIVVVGKVKDLAESFKNEKPDNTISVSAEGKVKAVPDLAAVSLGVLTQGQTPQKAQEENTKKTNKIIEFIKGQGIGREDIATSQFNISPRYSYRGGKSEIAGYRVNQTVVVKVRGVNKSTKILGKILKGAVSNGANQINGVNLSFNDPDELRQEARIKAIEKAKVKAKELAKVAGIKLGKVVSIFEAKGMTIPYPRNAKYTLNAGTEGVGGASPNIEPGSQDLTERMTVVFEVK